MFAARRRKPHAGGVCSHPNCMDSDNKAELNKILKLTEQNETKLLEAWHEHFDR
jgi:hypothetical protein